MDHLQIEKVFNQQFAGLRVQMVGGAAEPLYLPATEHAPARLFYREDYAASALHEAAHWSIAGCRRRLLVDFGYTYIAPPRTTQQQQAFFQFELRTQSLEALFARAAGVAFQVSADNLESPVATFARQVEDSIDATWGWVSNSTDQRALQFYRALERAASAQCLQVG